MTPEEREFWEEKSKDDQYRYNEEMMAFHEAQARSKPVKKDPNAPKRPMSAFLAFSNQRRASLKRSNPSLTNSDLSKALSQIWKNSPPEIKKEYIDQEAHLRAKYKEAMVAWRQSKKSSGSVIAPNLPSEPAHTARMLESTVVLPLTSSTAPAVNVVDNSFLAQHPDRWTRPQQASSETFFFPTEPILDYTHQGFWQAQTKEMGKLGIITFESFVSKVPSHSLSASTDHQNTESAELLDLYKQPISNIHFDTEGESGQHDEPSMFSRNMGDL